MTSLLPAPASQHKWVAFGDKNKEWDQWPLGARAAEWIRGQQSQGVKCNVLSKGPNPSWGDTKRPKNRLNLEVLAKYMKRHCPCQEPTIPWHRSQQGWLLSLVNAFLTDNRPKCPRAELWGGLGRVPDSSHKQQCFTRTRIGNVSLLSGKLMDQRWEA